MPRAKLYPWFHGPLCSATVHYLFAFAKVGLDLVEKYFPTREAPGARIDGPGVSVVPSRLPTGPPSGRSEDVAPKLVMRKEAGFMRMTHRTVALALVLITLVATQAPAGQIWTITQLSVAVVYLHRSEIQHVLDDGVEKEVWLKSPGEKSPQPRLIIKSGTGFLVADTAHLYLVTAAHVVKALGSSGGLVTLAGSQDTPETISLDELSGTPGVQAWVAHSSADVAVLVLKPSQQTIQRYLHGRFLPFEIFGVADAPPPRETQLTVIGFPKGLGVKGRFSPLTLQTLPASGFLNMRRFDESIDTDFFMLQNPSTGGYSGAPVIDVSRYVMGAVTTTGEGTRVYGLVHGTISDDTGGKLAAVVPARFIVETLRLASSAP